MKGVGKFSRQGKLIFFCHFMDCQASFAKMVRLFAGLGEAGAIRGHWPQPILNYGKAPGFLQMRCCLVHSDHAAVMEQALISLFDHKGKGLVEGKPIRKRNIEGKQ